MSNNIVLIYFKTGVNKYYMYSQLYPIFIHHLTQLMAILDHKYNENVSLNNTIFEHR